MSTIYQSLAWRRLRKRVLERDGSSCTYGRLFGGQCSSRLHVHHLIPVSEGGPELPEIQGCITLCEAHHPMIERLRRVLLSTPPETKTWKRCTHHQHRYPQGLIECELRLNRESAVA